MYLNCILLLKVELLCTVSSAFYITIRLSASISILSCLLSFVLSKIKLPMDLTVQIRHCTNEHFLHKLNHFLCMHSHLLSHKRHTSIVCPLSEIAYALNKTIQWYHYTLSTQSFWPNFSEDKTITLLWMVYSFQTPNWSQIVLPLSDYELEFWRYKFMMSLQHIGYIVIMHMQKVSMAKRESKIIFRTQEKLGWK